MSSRALQQEDIVIPQPIYGPQGSSAFGLRVDAGYVVVGDWSGPSWSDRVSTVTVTFKTPFLTRPIVHAGLSYLDVYNNAALRVEVFVENVTTTTFNVFFRTWADSEVYMGDQKGIKARWLAIGSSVPVGQH